MTDVSLAGAFLAGLISFLSPCVLPLVPGYISMLSGIGVEQLRQGEQPKSGLFSSALSFVLGFSTVFIGFGASASAVGGFLRQNRALLAPVAGALIILFGLHLLGGLMRMNLRAGLVLGVVLVALGIASLVHHGPLFAGLGASHFFSLSIIGFFGPQLARWLNRDVHLRSQDTKPGIVSGFLLGFAFAFGWTPCIGPILASILIVAATEGKVWHGMALLLVYSLGLGTPFFLSSLALHRFLIFFNRYKKHIRIMEIITGVFLIVIGVMIFTNYLSVLSGYASIWLGGGE